MKNLAIKLVWFTTFFVFSFAVISQTNISFTILFCLLLVGDFLILLMIYAVLSDKYSTQKKFKDWYKDHPMKTLDDKE